MVTISDMRDAICNTAAGRRIKDGDSLGTGIWQIENDIVLIGQQTAHRYTDGREFQQIDSPRFYSNGKVLDFDGTVQWYDSERLAAYLREAADRDWRKRVVDELFDLFSLWDNWEFQSSIEVSAGLILATWIQTVWKFRPLVSVSGPTNSGKTTLLDSALRGIFGYLLAPMQRSTEPGLRQEVHNTAVVVAIDEFEADRNRQNTFNLLRTSSRGGRTTRGTQKQKPLRFGLKHIVWTGAIETGMDSEADRNRFISINLKKIDKSNPDRSPFRLPKEADLRRLGEKAMAVAVFAAREANAMAEEIRTSINIRGVDSRYVECFAVPAAVLAVSCGWPIDDARGMVQRWIAERDIENQKVTDEEDLLEAIKTAVIRSGQYEYPVRKLVEACCSDAHGGSTAYSLDTSNSISGSAAEVMLESKGIKFIESRRVFHMHGKAITTHLLHNTKYKDMTINNILKRVDGAVEGYGKAAPATGGDASEEIAAASRRSRFGVFIEPRHLM